MKKLVQNTIYTILVIFFITSCNSIKGIKTDELLLENNKIIVNDIITEDVDVLSLIKQTPNSKALGLNIPLRLYIHNLSKKDSLKKYKKISFNKFLTGIGERPVLIDSLKTINTLKDIKSYYFSKGWFNVDGDFQIKTNSTKKASVNYLINLKKQFFIDSLSSNISSAVLDSIYRNSYPYSHIKINEAFNLEKFSDERKRLTNLFRNSGVYHFTQDYIEFENDTTNKIKKINTKLIIQDRIIKNNLGVIQKPFEIFKVSEVNVIIDFERNKENKLRKLVFDNYNFLVTKKIKLKAPAS